MEGSGFDTYHNTGQFLAMQLEVAVTVPASGTIHTCHMRPAAVSPGRAGSPAKPGSYQQDAAWASQHHEGLPQACNTSSSWSVEADHIAEPTACGYGQQCKGSAARRGL
eukprot:GHUV01013855.1.p4 GENE.GHUV01013855.1~~GHUV01013855.1.p4  ORF type:complete len:109 (+),score=34.44 GHUV01013855.1:1693-2019(+)